MANTGMVDPDVFDIAEDEEEADISQALIDLVYLLREMPGGTARNTVAIQLSGDAFAPVAGQCHHLIDSEGASGADNLANMTATGIRDGFIIFVSIANASRAITVKVSGNIATLDGNELVIADTKLEVPFRWDAAATKWRQMSAPELLARFNKLPGALPPAELTIASNSVTPVRGFHTIKASSGTSDTLNFAAQTTLSDDGSFLKLKAKTGHTITVGHNQSGTGKFMNSSGASESLTGDRILEYVKNGSQWDQVGSHGFSSTSSKIQNGGRLTLTTAAPVADAAAQGTLYWTPHKHGYISLWDGAQYVDVLPGEISKSVTATSGSAYEVWGYLNGGTLDLEFLVWTNTTTRATGLTRDAYGVLHKTGDQTRRWLGCFYASGTNQITDNVGLRGLFNAENKEDRAIGCADTTNSWNYNGSYREVNAGSTNGVSRIAIMCGDAMVAPNVTAVAGVWRNTGAADALLAIGLDSSTAKASDCVNGYGSAFASSFGPLSLGASFAGTLGLGLHTLRMLESAGSATTTWYGDNGGTSIQSGMRGTVRM